LPETSSACIAILFFLLVYQVFPMSFDLLFAKYFYNDGCIKFSVCIACFDTDKLFLLL